MDSLPPHPRRAGDARARGGRGGRRGVHALPRGAVSLAGLGGARRGHAKALQDGTLGGFFAFVNGELLPHLKALRERPGATPRQKVVSEIMSGVERTRIDTERNLLDVLDKVNELSGERVDPTHVFALSQVYEGLLLKMGEKGNDGGQFFTPREVIRAMVRVIDPRIGETVYDPGCGTGGFLAQAYEHMAGPGNAKIHSADQLDTLKRRTFYGREKDNAIYPIGLANLVLHDIDEPHIWHGNTLTGQETYGGLFTDAPALFDVILIARAAVQPAYHGIPLADESVTARLRVQIEHTAAGLQVALDEETMPSRNRRVRDPGGQKLSIGTPMRVPARPHRQGRPQQNLTIDGASTAFIRQHPRLDREPARRRLEISPSSYRRPHRVRARAMPTSSLLQVAIPCHPCAAPLGDRRPADLAAIALLSDHALGLPAGQIVARVAEQADEDLLVVLAGLGRQPAHAARRLRQLERRARGLQAAVDGMVELDEHLAGLHLRIGDHLGHVVDRRRGHAAPSTGSAPPRPWGAGRSSPG